MRNPKLKRKRLTEIKNEPNKLSKQNEHLAFEAKNKLLNEKGCYFSPNNDEIKHQLLGELFIEDYTTTNKCEKRNSCLIIYSIIINFDQLYL